MTFIILSLCLGDTVFICFKYVERKLMLVKFEIMVSCEQIFVVSDINIGITSLCIKSNNFVIY